GCSLYWRRAITPAASRARSRAVSRSRGAPVLRAMASNRRLPKAISRTASSDHFSPTRFMAAATEHGRPGSSSLTSPSLPQLQNQTYSGYAALVDGELGFQTLEWRVTENAADDGISTMAGGVPAASPRASAVLAEAGQ